MSTLLCILRNISFLAGLLTGFIGFVMDEDGISMFGAICFLVTTIFCFVIQVIS